MEQAGLLQPRHHQWYAARLVQVWGHEPAARLEVTQQRRPFADLVEIVDRELDPHLLGDREQVQDAVGRAAAAGDRGDRVLEALAGDDLARAQVIAKDAHDQLAGLL